MMQSAAKTYRNISAKIRFFGLEIGDWGALAAVAGIVFAISQCLTVNAAIIAALWIWMRKVKAVKPEGFTMAFISFQGSPKTFDCDLERK